MPSRVAQLHAKALICLGLSLAMSVPVAVFGQQNAPASVSADAQAEGQEAAPKPVLSIVLVKSMLDEARKAVFDGNQERAAELFEALVDLAYKAWKAEDQITAQSVFQQILELDPYHPGALFGLAEVHRQTGRSAWAIDYYKRYMKIKPADPEGYFGRGTCYLAMGAFNLAVQDLKHLIMWLDVNHIGGLTNLALALHGKAQTSGGKVDEFRQAVFYMTRAVERASLQDSQEIREELPDLRYRLGTLILKHQKAVAMAQPRSANFGAAIKQFDMAVEGKTEQSRRQPIELSYIEEVLRYVDAKFQVYAILAELNTKLKIQDVQPYMEMAELTKLRTNWIVRQGKILNAQYLEKACQIDPGYAEGHATLATTLLDLGVVDKALDQITLAVKLDPKNPAYRQFRQRLITAIRASTQPATRPAAGAPQPGRPPAAGPPSRPPMR